MKRISRIFLSFLVLIVSFFDIVSFGACYTLQNSLNSSSSSFESENIPSYSIPYLPDREVTEFVETHDTFHTSIKYDYYERWVHSSEGKNIYGNLYLPKDFDPQKEYPVIIMSHGFTGSHNFYTPYVFQLVPQGFVCYSYDFCGGAVDSRSDGSFYDMSVLTEVEDLKYVLSDIATQTIVKPSKIYLMGESQGGLVTALAAPEVAKYIESVILLYPALNIPEEQTAKYATYDDIPENPTIFDTRVGKEYMQDIYGLDVYHTIAQYEGKVLIYHGDNDGIIDISVSQKALRYYKNAELVTIPGGKHGFNTPISTEICADLVKRFLSNKT